MNTSINTLVSRLGLRFDTLFQAIALALFVGGAILALSELGSRIEYLGYLDSEIQSKSQELNAKLQAALQSKESEVGTPLRPSTSNDSLSSPSTGKESDPYLKPVSLTDRAIRDLSEELSQLSGQRALTTMLVFKGARNDHRDLTYIMNLSNADVVPEKKSDDLVHGFDIIATMNLFLPIRFDLLSSNILVAILLTSSGAIGALTGGLRTDEFTTFRDICLGLATGFICYLTIRGGKDLFVANTALSRTALNPYSSGLTAILAGLFSERFFQLLSFLFDSISARLKAAFGDEKEKPSDQKA